MVDAESLKFVFATNRSWSEWATIIVFIGLLGDILVIFLFSKDKPKSETWLAFACTLFIALGVFGEYRYGGKASEAADKLQQISDEKVAGANQKVEEARKDAEYAKDRASKADERASKNEKEAATLRKRAEDEAMARVEIEQRVAWRRLTTKQQADIGLHLSKLPPQFVSVWYVGPDMECETFAGDIARALRATRTWAVGPPGGLIQMAEGGSFKGPIPDLVTGVTVVGTAADPTRAAADAIVKELLGLGFDAAMSPKTEKGNFPQIWVNVEHRPEGPQGEAKLRTLRSKKK
jgi:hypothetical protein